MPDIYSNLRGEMRKALVNRVTGIVDNIIELEDDSSWENPFPEYDVVDGTGCGGQGWTYDGEVFAEPVPPTISRIDELMTAATSTIVDGEIVATPEETLASERLELRGLLEAKLLSNPDTITQQELNKLMQLDRIISD